MGRNGYTYEARKDGEVIIGKASELAKELGVTREKVTCAYQQGYRCNGYELSLAETPEKCEEITPEMWQQWDDICMVFRRAYAQRM